MTWLLWCWGVGGALEFNEARARRFVGVDESVTVDVFERPDGLTLVQVDGVQVGSTSVAILNRYVQGYRSDEALTGFQIRKVGRKIAYQGTERLLWAIVHRGDDILLVENRGPPALTRSDEAYRSFNGEGLSGFQGFAEKCPGVAVPQGTGRASGALRLALEDLCADKDYRAALSTYASIRVTTGPKAAVKKKGNRLMISIPKDPANPRLLLRKELEDEL